MEHANGPGPRLPPHAAWLRSGRCGDPAAARKPGSHTTLGDRTGTLWGARVTPASVELRLDLDSVAHDFVRFGTGARAHRLAVLDLTGADQSLASADDAQQEELLAGRAQFLNAQLADFQVLVRAEPVDLSGHLERVRRQAIGLPEAFQQLAQEYASFVRTLAHQRTLLERRCYVILPVTAPTSGTGRPGLLDGLRRLLKQTPPASEALLEPDLARQLVARCDHAARDLARSRLQARRLTGLGYAQLADRCWAPEQARTSASSARLRTTQP